MCIVLNSLPIYFGWHKFLLRHSKRTCYAAVWVIGLPHAWVTSHPRHRRHDAQCRCGLPQYFVHTSDSAQATAGQRCKWILTHNLTLIIPALPHYRGDPLSCNIHGGVYSTLIYSWRCIFYIDLYMEVYILDDISLIMQVYSSPFFEFESSARSAILSEVHADCCPSRD